MTRESPPDDQAERYRLIGQLLLRNLDALKKGMQHVTLDADSQEKVRISLDESLTPPQNAERYFDKAKKLKSASQEQSGRRNKLAGEIRALDALLGEIDLVANQNDLEDFVKTHKHDLEVAGIHLDPRGRERPEERIPFRVFTVSGGFSVWAGKSSENNDLLTTKYSRPSDLWFHARGAGGSHVVLKRDSAKGQPSKEAIEEAASIAAYYSKMRSAKIVPVAMAERKYVRKPRGVPAGTVSVEREKVLFVEPGLPEKEKEK
jgi:predicted ribosome quality control (RQC) complex YloA/Tae2 family protein